MSNKSNMTNCKHCNWEIAKVAKACPKCGAKTNKTSHKIIMIIISIIFFYLFMLVILILGSFKISSSNENQTTTLNSIESNIQETSSKEISSNITQNNTISEENIKEKEVINLKFDNIGNYGKKDNYNIRYYLPNGKYNVTSNSEISSGFFIIKNEKVKNSEGKLEDVIIQDVRFNSNNTTKEVTIPKNTHIILFINSDLDFEKID